MRFSDILLLIATLPGLVTFIIFLYDRTFNKRDKRIDKIEKGVKNNRLDIKTIIDLEYSENGKLAAFQRKREVNKNEQE